MENETILSILKWIGLVFAAGFIGYFGKYLSKIIIAKFRKQKKTIDSATPSETIPSTKEKYDYKLEKKKLKLEKKKQKKELKTK